MCASLAIAETDNSWESLMQSFVASRRQPRGRINNTALLASAPGVKVVHVRPDGNSPKLRRKALTVAFRQNHKGHNIEIATAVVNPNDAFSRKIGTKLAVENFLDGKTTTIPDAYSNAVRSIRYMFGQYGN